ncbi:MAG: Wzt carbohydrate-binding domain-containing protein, partial [Planctomycetota bacterium]
TLVGPDGAPARVFGTGESFTVRIGYQVHSAVERPVFGVGLYRSDGTYVNGSNHEWREQPIDIGRVEPGEHGEVDVALGSLPLLRGEYYVSTFLYDHSKPAPTPIDHRERVARFEVIDHQARQHGMVTLPTAWAVRRRLPDGTAIDVESAS